jgi:hypothetical protein
MIFFRAVPSPVPRAEAAFCDRRPHPRKLASSQPYKPLKNYTNTQGLQM